MFKHVVASLLAFAVCGQAHASEVLLSCGLPIGPVQELKVAVENDKAILKELTMDSAVVERALTKEEWDGKEINLHKTELEEIATLTFDGQDWQVYIYGYGATGIAFADCQ